MLSNMKIRTAIVLFVAAAFSATDKIFSGMGGRAINVYAIKLCCIELTIKM